MSAEKWEIPELISLREIARLLDVSPNRVCNLSASGILPKAVDGKYRAVDCVHAYIVHCRTERANAAKPDARSEAMRLRLLTAKAQKVEQEVLLRAGELVEMSIVVDEVSRQFSMTRERLLSVPAKIADACVGLDRHQIEQLIDDEINEALSELNDPHYGKEKGPQANARAPKARKAKHSRGLRP